MLTRLLEDAVMLDTFKACTHMNTHKDQHKQTLGVQVMELTSKRCVGQNGLFDILHFSDSCLKKKTGMLHC